MRHTEQRKRLREVFAGKQCVSPASVYDGLSARVAESVGYRIGMLAGSVASQTTLAAPDLIVLTLTEFADQVRRIMRASDLSLIVDADHGYGNVMFVAGAGVRGGYHGRWPGLANSYDSDLTVTTDYRQVLADVVQARFPGASVPKVFPGLKRQSTGCMLGV